MLPVSEYYCWCFKTVYNLCFQQRISNNSQLFPKLFSFWPVNFSLLLFFCVVFFKIFSKKWKIIQSYYCALKIANNIYNICDIDFAIRRPRKICKWPLLVKVWLPKKCNQWKKCTAKINDALNWMTPANCYLQKLFTPNFFWTPENVDPKN